MKKIKRRQNPDMIDILPVKPLPVKPPPCICGRGKFYHPWRFCDNYTPVNGC